MIVKPVSRLIQELDAASFTVVGCPAADGMGVDSLQVYARALAGAEGDFIVTLGDIVPCGRDVHYLEMANLVDNATDKPVHVLKGAADTDEFEEYFGVADRAVLSEDYTLIMLDCTGGRFSDATLAFLRDTLALSRAPNLVVAMQTPPPNRMSGDTLSIKEWARFEDAVGVWRKRITLLLAGRNRTYYEDDVDGIRLMVTGGGGAGMEDAERGRHSVHHALEFAVDGDGVLAGRVREVRPDVWRDREPEISETLRAAFASECAAHVSHLLHAEEAKTRGLGGLARLFRAAAESRLRHARHLRRVFDPSRDPRNAVVKSLKEALRLEDEKRSDLIAAADMARDSIASRMLLEILSSEKNHADLFEHALAELSIGDDIAQTAYHTCATCGTLVPGYDPPATCPTCGAPGYLIRPVR